MDLDEKYTKEIQAGKLAAEEVEKHRLEKGRFIVNHKPDEKETIGKKAKVDAV